MFSYERLEVYKLAVQFSERVSVLQPKIAEHSKSLATNFLRCSESIETNIAEGASHIAPKVKAHFYRLARGSASECSSILRRSVRMGYVSHEETIEDQILLNRISFLLLQLIRSMENDA